MRIWHKKRNPTIKKDIDKFLVVKKKDKNIMIGYYHNGHWYKGKAYSGNKFMGYIDEIEIEAWIYIPKYKSKVK